MIDHVSCGVSNLTSARRFYDAFFEPLGHALASLAQGEIAYGPGGTSGTFFLYQAPAGVQIAGAHPDISPSYYGAVVLDPDGNRLEVRAQS